MNAWRFGEGYGERVHLYRDRQSDPQAARYRQKGNIITICIMLLDHKKVINTGFGCEKRFHPRYQTDTIE